MLTINFFWWNTRRFLKTWIMLSHSKVFWQKAKEISLFCYLKPLFSTYEKLLMLQLNLKLSLREHRESTTRHWNFIKKVQLTVPTCFSESISISLYIHFHLHTLHSNNSKPVISSSARRIWEFSQVGLALIWGVLLNFSCKFSAP